MNNQQKAVLLLTGSPYFLNEKINDNNVNLLRSNTSNFFSCCSTDSDLKYETNVFEKKGSVKNKNEKFPDKPL
jgi:hypothetical protein